MVSKDINSLNEIKSGNFLNLFNRFRIQEFIRSLDRLMIVESIPDESRNWIVRRLYSCIHSYIKHYSLLDNDSKREEYREASKRHQRQLNSIITYVIQSFKTDGLSTIITLERYHIKIKVDTIELFDQRVNPRSFIGWYEILKIFQHCEDMTIEQIIVIARVLTTLYGIVNEVVLRPEEKDRETLKLVDLLSKPAKYSSIDDFISSNTNGNPDIHQGIEDLKETIQLIKLYLNSNIQVPFWATDIVTSLRRLERNQRLFVYDNINPMLSLNSTCTHMKYKHKTITVPGIFASCLEPDYFKENFPNSNFDSIVGFKQTYKIDMEDFIKKYKVKSKRRFSVSIDQKKPKPRIIHPLNNSEQDRLIYFHRLMEYVLSNLPSDCMFDQTKGPQHIKDVMVNRDQDAIYSLDLTSATDTFNIGLQYLIIKDLIFNNNDHAEELSNVWLDIMRSETSIDIGGTEKKFKFSNGQPQGFLSSFTAFSLEHHIVMLTVLRKSNMVIKPNDFYKVLGDDCLITTYDKDMVIPDLYIHYINSANVECNIQKGYLYNPNNPDRSVKIAEFAKQLIIDGSELTPIPITLLSRTDTISDSIALCGWFSKHSDKRWKLSNLKYYLTLWNRFDSEYYSSILDLMVMLSLPGILFESFERSFKRLMTGFTRDDTLIIQRLLMNTLIYSVVDRLTGTKDIPEGIEGLIKVSTEIKPIITSLNDRAKVDKNNKVLILKESIQNIFYTFKELCNRYISSGKLDDDDILLACMIMQINNKDQGADKISNLIKAFDLLLVNPYDISNDDQVDLVANQMLNLFKEFNITIDRSWNNFNRHIPIDFLNEAIKVVDDLLKDKSMNHGLYVGENGYDVQPDSITYHGNVLSNNLIFDIDDIPEDSESIWEDVM